jgi:hypothetical protein
MSGFKLTDAEKKKILERHKEAHKSHFDRVEELKKGLQKPKNPKGK